MRPVRASRRRAVCRSATSIMLNSCPAVRQGFEGDGSSRTAGMPQRPWQRWPALRRPSGTRSVGLAAAMPRRSSSTLPAVPASHVSGVGHRQEVRRPDRRRRQAVAARAPALLRHAPPRPRCRPSHRPGVARARIHLDHPGLHACQPGTTFRRLPIGAPESARPMSHLAHLGRRFVTSLSRREPDARGYRVGGLATSSTARSRCGGRCPSPTAGTRSPSPVDSKPAVLDRARRSPAPCCTTSARSMPGSARSDTASSPPSPVHAPSGSGAIAITNRSAPTCSLLPDPTPSPSTSSWPRRCCRSATRRRQHLAGRRHLAGKKPIAL